MTRWRRQVCRGLVAVLLLAQWAVAAYACPALSPQPESAVTTAADQAAPGMPGCDGMMGNLDPAAPNLCAEHCKVGQQTDQTPGGAVPPALLYGLYIVAAPIVSTGTARSASASVGLHAAATPPHSVLHCCLRI